MRTYVHLGAAIAAEVFGTSMLKLSDGFETVLPGAVAMIAYVASFYYVSLALTELPVGLVYATWSAFGIVGIAAIGAVFFDETVDAVGLAGILLVLVGIFLLNVYSEGYSPA